MELNRTPENYFAEVEQAAFDPGHMVPGVGPSPDKMLQARLFAYGDAHRYRLGINHTQLPVNSPKGCGFDHGQNYGRDGAMRFDSNAGRSVNYEPNSFGGPAQTNAPMYAGFDLGEVSGTYQPEIRGVDDFQQAGDLYRLMDAGAQQRLVDAVAGSLSRVQRTPVGDGIVSRSIDHFRKADADFGSRLDSAVTSLRS